MLCEPSDGSNNFSESTERLLRCPKLWANNHLPLFFSQSNRHIGFYFSICKMHGFLPFWDFDSPEAWFFMCLLYRWIFSSFCKLCNACSIDGSSTSIALIIFIFDLFGKPLKSLSCLVLPGNELSRPYQDGLGIAQRNPMCFQASNRAVCQRPLPMLRGIRSDSAPTYNKLT